MVRRLIQTARFTARRRDYPEMRDFFVRVEIHIDARRLPVDADLRAAAQPRARTIYEELGPEAGELSALTITAVVTKKGSPIDLYVDAAEGASGRVLVRVPGSEGMSRWPAGTRIGITLAADKAIAFGPADRGQS